MERQGQGGRCQDTRQGREQGKQQQAMKPKQRSKKKERTQEQVQNDYRRRFFFSLWFCVRVEQKVFFQKAGWLVGL